MGSHTLLRPVKYTSLVCSLFLASACSSSAGRPSGTSVSPPPVADKQPKTITVHGDSRVDDYFWLREQSNPKVTDYLKAEDAYTDAVMKPTAALQDTLFKEMVGHIKETDDTSPIGAATTSTYSRTTAGLKYPSIAAARQLHRA